MPTRPGLTALRRISESTVPSTASSARARWRRTSWCRSTGRCFGMKTACFRGGCLTGPAHSAAELHRLPGLPHQVLQDRPEVPHLRLQGQAGAGQHPLAGCLPRAGVLLSIRAAARSTTWAAGAATASPSLRPSPRPRRSPGRSCRPNTSTRTTRRRPHLLHLQPRQAPQPFPRLGHRPQDPRRHLQRDRGGGGGWLENTLDKLQP